MRVALLPLDDRPCHTRFPARLAEAAGIELLLPPREMLGWFDRPGDADGLLDWLAGVAPRVDGIGVCLEMLTCGGLVASRRPDTPAAVVAARLDRLGDVLRTVQGPTLLGSVIMRATITVTGDQSTDAYALVARYAELRPSADAGNVEAAEEVRSIVAALPAGLLDAYLEARRRNHSANLRAVDLVKQGAASGLILTQEDCRPRGIHRAEQEALRSRAEPLGPRVLIHPGADELSVVLLARVAAEVADHRPTARVAILPRSSEETIAPFEDAPIRETVLGQAAASGLSWTDDPRAPQLLVIGPIEQPTDLSGDDYGGAVPPDDLAWINEFGAAAAHGSRSPVVVADTAVANGAYLPAFRYLRGSEVWERCHSYIGWNTAGNTVGTATAILSLLPLMDEPMDRLRRFRLERLMDDVAYQSVVRRTLVEWIRARGEDPHRMTPGGARAAEAWLAGELRQAAEELDVAPSGLRWWIKLPWDRAFECDVEWLGG